MNADSSEHLSVVVIEDQQAEVDLIRTALKRARGIQFDIMHAERLSEGLRYLQHTTADVLLLDLCLPDSTGYATLEKVQRAAPKVPVIVMTNMNDEDQAIRAVREGAQDYLIKRNVDGGLLVRSIRYTIARFRAEEALRTSEARYALAVQGSNDGIWDWDLRSGIVYFSARWSAILGCVDEEVEGTMDSWIERVHPEDSPEFQRLLDEHLVGNSNHFSYEHRIRGCDGSYRWVLSRGLAFRRDGAEPERMAGSLTDITRRKQVEEQLVRDALFDRLTRLPNRNLLLDRLDMAVRRYQGRERRDFALLFLDLDRFKNVNDSLGHYVGDQLLCRIGEALAAAVRPGDTVARLGGDEFVILLAEVASPTQVVHVSERILATCARRFQISEHEVQTSATIGIALATGGYTCALDVLRDADIALNSAKSAGKARYHVFDSKMHGRVVALQKLEMDLRHALERDEFEMHYQPILSLTGAGLVGFEALIRWHRPLQGMVPPALFIPAAEECGLIVPIGWWTLREACRKARQWQIKFPRDRRLMINVNVSSKLFHRPDLVVRVREILEKSELPPESLCLEITENVLLLHAEEALDRFRELRQLGVCLQVDDFGTGFSSMSYLREFAYDGLKIDRSFISETRESSECAAIVEAIISLGKRLGMNVIAEGVESHQQLECLKEMDCPQVQGFLFSRPLDCATIERLLADPPAWTRPLEEEPRVSAPTVMTQQRADKSPDR